MEAPILDSQYNKRTQQTSVVTVVRGQDTPPKCIRSKARVSLFNNICTFPSQTSQLVVLVQVMHITFM